MVHRDLKPANVRVTADGRPKLLDFGLAKALENDDGGDATQTAPWLTPAYAGPEQLKHGRVSILTDVYALGVVLYELVTGVKPYQVDGLNPAELTRVVCEVVPRAPSTVVKDTAAFGTPVGAVRRMLAGDVDVIVLKALAKEPERRYGSVAELGGRHPALSTRSAGAGTSGQLDLSHLEAGTPAQDDGGRPGRGPGVSDRWIGRRTLAGESGEYRPEPSRGRAPAVAGCE